MHQQSRPFYVAQKFVPEPDTVGCSMHQPGYVGDHIAVAVPTLHDTKVGLQRRKRVVGYLWARLGHRGQQRRFSSIRESDNADVCEQLQLQFQLALDTRLPRLAPRRTSAPRCGELRIASASLST